METITAILNAGRWMVYCPIHGKDGAVLAMDYHATDPNQSSFWTQNNEYICPVCYAGIIARLTVLKKQQIQRIPDKNAVATARAMAEAEGRVYQVVFPDDKEAIEMIVSSRPKLMQHWEQGETVGFLEMENLIIGVK